MVIHPEFRCLFDFHFFALLFLGFGFVMVYSLLTYGLLNRNQHLVYLQRNL